MFEEAQGNLTYLGDVEILIVLEKERRLFRLRGKDVTIDLPLITDEDFGKFQSYHEIFDEALVYEDGVRYITIDCPENIEDFIKPFEEELTEKIEEEIMAEEYYSAII